MIALCLAAAMGGAVARVEVPDQGFTLRWIHSIEKIAWEEDWRVSPHGMIGGEVRIKGSGAGMEPAPDAVLRDGWYRWTMPPEPLPRLSLARSEFVPDHQICFSGRCTRLSDLVGGTGPVTAEPCHAP